MSATWQGEAPPDLPRPGLGGWLRVALRGAGVGTLVFGGLALLLLVRLLEAPLYGPARPVSPHITMWVSRAALVLLGVRLRVVGAPMQGPGAVVSNHASWLDIFALNARKRIYFVSKDEVAGWAGIGWLARATGTLFISRDRRQASAQVALFRRRLGLGHKLLFFPEGTSSNSRMVLPFKSTLFAAFFAPGLAESLSVQPVTLRYLAPPGQDARFYGWWGDMTLAPHLITILAAPRQGAIEVVYHPPVRVADFTDRKALAQYCEVEVRKGLDGLV